MTIGYGTAEDIDFVDFWRVKMPAVLDFRSAKILNLWLQKKRLDQMRMGMMM
jgi:hypothetical protein